MRVSLWLTVIEGGAVAVADSRRALILRSILPIMPADVDTRSIFFVILFMLPAVVLRCVCVASFPRDFLSGFHSSKLEI